MGQEAAERVTEAAIGRALEPVCVCIPRRLVSWPSPSGLARLNPPINLVFRTTEP